MIQDLTQLLVTEQYHKETPTETSAAWANALNSYISAHVLLNGSYTGVIPPGIPEAGVGLWKLDPQIQPIPFADFNTWLNLLTLAIQTQVFLIPTSITAPITIITPMVPCLALTNVILTQQMLQDSLWSNVDYSTGNLMTSHDETQRSCMEVIATTIIEAIRIGFTVTPYPSTMVGTGVTVFNSVTII